MRFDEMTIRVLVRKSYGECFDFYTEKIGLVPVWDDRNGPYTSFAVSKDSPPCFAIFSGANMSDFEGYIQPSGNSQPDTITAIIPTEDLDGDYKRLMGEDRFKGNAELTRHIWENLISNAVKYCDQGGKISIKLNVEGALRFEVSNTGEGIPAEDQSHIFRQFYMADKSKAKNGTGLGLPFVKKLLISWAGPSVSRAGRA